MIRAMRQDEIEDIMRIWIEANTTAHSFIPQTYWESNFETVKSMVMEGVTVYEEAGEVLGFMGIRDGYIAGIFVKTGRRSEGIGEKLIDEAKAEYSALTLHVYVDNRQAVKFYLREEFRVTDKAANQETGADEYKMEWRR